MDDIGNHNMQEYQLEKLSNREQQIAHKIIEGLPNKLIANSLFISERTVKFHCANIYRKLEVRNRNMLTSWYFRGKYENVASVAEPSPKHEFNRRFDD